MNDQAVRQQVMDFAMENFRNGLNCAEAVYEALLRSGALKAPKETLAMATGFGGGGGLSGNTCGALSAAIMACGAVYGRPDPWAVPAEERGKEIQSKYYRRYNNLIHDLQGLMAAPCAGIFGPYGDFHDKERRRNCLKLVGATAALAYDYLQKEQAEAFAMPYRENLAGLE